MLNRVGVAGIKVDKFVGLVTVRSGFRDSSSIIIGASEGLNAGSL